MVEGCTLSKITYKNKDYETKLIATDQTLDLALLKAEIKPKSYFAFAKDEAKKRSHEKQSKSKYELPLTKMRQKQTKKNNSQNCNPPGPDRGARTTNLHASYILSLTYTGRKHHFDCFLH